MTGSVTSSVIGKWRIVEADLWDRDYLDLVEPAYIAFGDQGYGDFAFGCVTGGMECEYSPSIIFFTRDGMDEMDEVLSEGSAEISDDGTLEIEIRFRYGDEAILKARKWRVFQQPARAQTIISSRLIVLSIRASYSP